MNKTIIALVVLVLIAAVVYVFAMDREPADIPQMEENATEEDTELDEIPAASEREVRGIIVSVNTNEIAFDGPSLITVRQESGTQAVIAIPSMGINLCAAQANIADISGLEVGDRIEVNGEVDEDGRIVPCESSTHYLRIAE